jgi:hypothetical protein
METRIEWVTPDHARLMLSNMIANRKVSRSAVDRYARDMRAGRWHAASALALDSEGRLVDGQHRLLAVIEAGVPVQMQVTRGADGYFAVVDQHRPRSVSFVAECAGMTQGKNLVTALNAIRAYCGTTNYTVSGSWARCRVSSAEFLAWINEHPEIIKSLHVAQSVKHLGTLSSLTAMHWSLSVVDEIRTNRAFAILADMIESSRDDVWRQAKERLLRIRSYYRAIERTSAAMEVLTHAWNADCQGKKLARVIYTRTGTRITQIDTVRAAARWMD